DERLQPQSSRARGRGRGAEHQRACERGQARRPAGGGDDRRHHSGRERAPSRRRLSRRRHDDRRRKREAFDRRDGRGSGDQRAADHRGPDDLRKVEKTVIWGVVLAAAGRGVRFGRPKQLIDLAGKPALAWSFDAFASMPEVDEIVVVTEPEYVAAVKALVAARAGDARVVVVPGGEDRQ